MSILDSRWIKDVNAVTQEMKFEDVIVNPCLIFNKYVLWDKTDEDVPTLNKKIVNGKESTEKNYHKMEHFNRIINCNLPLNSDNYEYLKKRKNMLSNKLPFNLTTKTKIIVNHGQDSVLENSIAFHPYYGFPVIPGSAIKGVTRSFCEDFYEEIENLDEEKITAIFGAQSKDKKAISNHRKSEKASEGKVIFLDAWPSLKGIAEKNKNISLRDFFETDVFTPHYQKYYQKKKSSSDDQEGIFPSDDQKSIPINFLAVKKKIEFEFVIALTSNSKNIDLEIIKNFVRNALKIYGIGAKTGSSYGYFE